jgi:hypothetical protein
MDFIEEMLPESFFVNDGSLIVPFPGTELYRQYKEEFRFEGWWLSDRYRRRELHLYQRLLLYDPTIERPFFPLSPQMRETIKRNHNRINERLILHSFLKERPGERGRVVFYASAPRKSFYIIAKTLKLAFIKMSRALSIISPSLELKVLIPAYNNAKRLWVRIARLI